MSELLKPKVIVVEVLAALVTAFALIPEVVSFSVAAGLNPQVGLCTSFAFAIVIAFFGGRPAMISAAAGSVIVVAIPLVHSHGSAFLVWAVLGAGIFQIILGVIGVANLVRFVPVSVMHGFVNALAVIIFMAQVPHLFGENEHEVWVLVAIGLFIIVVIPRLLPKIFSYIPAPLVSILVVTLIAIGFGLHVPTIHDEGTMPHGLPSFLLPHIPFGLGSLETILPYAASIAFVGLLETLLTAELVDDITDTPSNKTRESIGQGIANLFGGLFGGQPGCAMIGQTLVNVKQGKARTRLSTALAGIFMFVLVVFMGKYIGRIPMAALVAVMIMVSVATFEWHSISPATLKKIPKTETLIMVIVVIATVWSGNLAIGVTIGVVLTCILFAQKLSQIVEAKETSPGVYTVEGQLFFASSSNLVHQFNYAKDPEHIRIDLSKTHIWDTTAKNALDTIEYRYKQHGKTVEIIGA